MRDEAWDTFLTTGKVDDYLKFCKERNKTNNFIDKQLIEYTRYRKE